MTENTLHQAFEQRRQALMSLMVSDSMAVLPAAPLLMRNRDVPIPYRPDSDFYYLSGFTEPHALIVLIPGRLQGEYLLFCQEHDATRERWHGPCAGLEGACLLYGADDAFPIEDADDILPSLLEGCRRLYYPMGRYADFDAQVMSWLNYLRALVGMDICPPAELVALDPLLHELRLYKSPMELEAMRYAADVAVQAHRRAMRFCHSGLYEYQLAAELTHEFMRHGCHSAAYPSIVAGGTNACILHYLDNNARLQDGDLVLVDAGAEYNFYASDISRTYPVNGRFSTSQQQLYEVVLAARQAAIREVKPGNHWNVPHEAALQTIVDGLLALGIVRGEPEAVLQEERYKPFFMHRTGHWIGLDVHDVGGYRLGDQWRMLEPGMTLSIEPGLYLSPETQGIPDVFRGLGIRIEDVVLVTENGHEVLTSGVPGDISGIESCMAKRD